MLLPVGAAGLLAGHVLLARQLLALRPLQAAAAEVYANITALMMQQKHGDKLAAALAHAVLVSLQHDQPFGIYFTTQLASLCSKDLGAGSGQQQAPNEARGCAMLQALLLVAAEDAALAGVLLQVGDGARRHLPGLVRTKPLACTRCVLLRPPLLHGRCCRAAAAAAARRRCASCCWTWHHRLCRQRAPRDSSRRGC